MSYFKDYNGNKRDYKNSNDSERYVEECEDERKKLDRKEITYEYGRSEKQTYEH